MKDILMKKFFRNRYSFGSWITFTSLASAEIMAKAGFDWLAVDMEHSPIGIERAQEIIQVIELSGIIPLVRLSSNDPVQIKRVMDAGAYGIIVPNIENAGQLNAAIKATRYPPHGTRGVGLARAQAYGKGFAGYRDGIGRNCIVIAQIESRAGVENIEAIVGLDGLTGVMIGPYDLSGSYGVAGQLGHPKVRLAERQILKACEKKGVPCGSHIVFPDKKQLTDRMRSGYRILAFGVDMIFMLEASGRAVDLFKRLRGGLAR